VWVFVNLPTIIYLLNYDTMESYQLSFSACTCYVTYWLVIGVPYVAMETNGVARATVIRSQMQAYAWWSFGYRPIGTGSTCTVKSFLVETSGIGESLFWQTNPPVHISGIGDVAGKFRRLSSADAIQIDRRLNVYSQSFGSQVLFVVVAAWFALVPTWMRTFEWEEYTGLSMLQEAVLSLYSIGTGWMWYGVYGILFNKPMRDFGKCSTVARRFRAHTTAAALRRCQHKSRMATARTRDEDSGGASDNIDFDDSMGVAAFFVARAVAYDKIVSYTDNHFASLGPLLVLACLAAGVLLILSVAHPEVSTHIPSDVDACTAPSLTHSNPSRARSR
jgi:hypothetical protein